MVSYQLRALEKVVMSPFPFPLEHAWKLIENRLVANVVKVDSHLAILSGCCPLLKMEQITLGIPATFAMWNAYAFTSFYERLSAEPQDRQQHSMCDFTTGMPAIDSRIMIEDVHLGLSALVPRILGLTWCTNKHKTGGTADLEELVSKLNTWEECLQDIRDMLDIQKPGSETDDAFLKAYRGAEEASSKKAVTRRMSILGFSTMTLCRTLTIQVHLQMWNDSRVKIPEVHESVESDVDIHGKQIVHGDAPQHLRHALWNSIKALLSYESMTYEHRANLEVVDPLASTTMLRGAKVADSWFSSCPTACEANVGYCQASKGFLGFENPDEIGKWLQHGGMLVVQEIPFCRCRMDYWMSRFLQGESRSWQNHIS